MPKIILILIVVLVVGVGGFLLLKSHRPVASSGYQAVFLTNKEVYFGKVAETSGDYVTLNDVHYLVSQTPAADQKQASPSANFSLLKLSDSSLKPEDTMIINRRQIVLIEDLKPDSNVVKTILGQQGK